MVLGHAGAGAVSPRAEALLYAADRAHHVATVVRPALARGAVVISDRYVDSSLAYQGAGRTLPVEEVSWLSSWATGGLKPDLVVLLDVDPTVGPAPGRRRAGRADRLEAESLAFHERVRYAFLDLAAADPGRYLVLDATRPADELTSSVVERVDAAAARAGARASAAGQPARHVHEPTLTDDERAAVEARWRDARPVGLRPVRPAGHAGRPVEEATARIEIRTVGSAAAQDGPGRTLRRGPRHDGRPALTPTA